MVKHKINLKTYFSQIKVQDLRRNIVEIQKSRKATKASLITMMLKKIPGVTAKHLKKSQQVFKIKSLLSTIRKAMNKIGAN